MSKEKLLINDSKGNNGEVISNKETEEIKEMVIDVARSISWCNEEIPTVDCLGTAALLYNKNYRKVTRCKDCVYSYFNTSSERYSCDREYPRRSVEEDDFCNYAKMKGGAE